MDDIQTIQIVSLCGEKESWFKNKASISEGNNEIIHDITSQLADFFEQLARILTS